MRKFYACLNRALFLLQIITLVSLNLNAQNKITSISIDATQTGTIVYGTPNSASYNITLNTDGNATPGTTDLGLSWSGAVPAGVSYSFSPASPVTIPGNSTSQNVTLTITSAANTDAAAYNFTVSSTNDVFTSGSASFIVDQKVLTVTATASNKEYDGNTTAAVTFSDDRISGDVFNVSYSTATFSDKNVGTNKTVTVSGITISGTDAGNYTLAPVAVTDQADITAKVLTVTATASDKEYDGNTTAAVTFSNDRATGDVFTISYGTANFSDKNVGTNKTVTVNGITISGTDAGNYTLASTSATDQADITAKVLTVTATASDKVYDGNTTATVSLSDDRTTGDVITVTYGTATFSDKNVGTNKTVTVSGITISGTDAGNYTLASTTATAQANITAKALTVTATASNKAYDGNTTAAVTFSDDRTTGDVITVTYGTATFSDKNVGTNKTVTVNGISISGTDAGNYTLASTTATDQADITAKVLTVTATASDKVYDGNTTAAVTFSDDRATDDVLTVSYGSATFSDKNVGTNKTVTVNGISISGADAGNYTLASTTATDQADITAKVLTVTATALDKVYDGNTTATVSLSDDRATDDVLTVSYGSATFSDKNVGTNKTVTVNGISISGADAGNYTLASTTATDQADITAKVLTVTATALDKVYDGNTTATVSLSDDRATDDVLTVSYGSATFSDKNVGTNKTVTVNGISISGTDAGNYTLAATSVIDYADITAAPTSVIVTTSSSPVCLNTPVTFAATITSVLSGATGTVNFFDGGAPIGSATVSGTTATLTIATLTSGTHSITASLVSSNPNYSGNTSVAINQVINPLPTISLGALPQFCPGNPGSFNLVYVGTTGSPTSYSITAGTPALAGFVPVVDASLSGSPLTINLPPSVPAGTYQFVITVKNANGCVSSAQNFNVTFLDNTKPTINCPGDITVNANTGCTATGVSLGTPSTSDNCSVATVTNDAPTAFPIGVTTVTWTVTDASGNTNTCTQQVTVVDQTPPVAICKNITVNLDATGNATIVAADIDNGSTDNCGIASISINKASFNCSNVGANSVTLTVTDNSGNSSSCTATVTVIDNTPPVAVAKPFTLYLNASGNATLSVNDIDNGSTDNCSSFTRSISKTSFDCSNLGANTVTLTVTDASGNVATATATVTVIDNIAPQVICKNITVDLSASGTATITAEDLNNGSTDNCGIATLSISKSTFDCSNMGSNSVTLTATDASGNTSNCTATVLIRDLVPPTAICKPATIYLNASGQAVLTTADVDNGSNDNCGPVTLSLSKTTFDCSTRGANTVTLTVKDASGNQSTCQTTVTVVDNILPTAICKPFTLTLNAATGTGTLSSSDINNGSTDNCGISTYQISKDGTNFYNTLSYNCSDVGTKTVYLKVTDAAGNSSTCQTNITVQSTLIITSMTLDVCGGWFHSSVTGGAGSYTYYWEDIGGSGQKIFRKYKYFWGIPYNPTNYYTSDNSDPALNLGIPDGSYTVRLTVTDNKGCQVIKDFTFIKGNYTSTSSSKSCLGETVTYTSTKSDAWWVDYSYDWVVQGTEGVDYDKISGGGLDDKTITIRWNTPGTRYVRVTNTPDIIIIGEGTACISIEQNNVTVHSLPTPAFQTPPSTTVCPNSEETYYLQTPNTFASRTWSVTGGTITGWGGSNDNSVKVKWGTGATGKIIVTVANSAANGGCTNTTSLSVNIVDNTWPTITCPSNVTVNADAGQCSATGVNLGTPTTNDNCGVASVTNNAPSSFPIGVTTVTWTVTDYKGHTATCTQTVTVVDNQFPVINCNQGNITLNNDANSCSATFAPATNPAFSDNCTGTKLTWAMTGATTGSSPLTGINYIGSKTYNIGVTTVTYTVTDASGNSSTCSFNVTVKDNTAPTITAPADINTTTNNACTATGVNLGTPTIGDNCTGTTVTNNAPANFPVGTTTVTWTATDASGNTSTATQTVTVTDNIDPTIAQIADITTTSAIGQCSRSVNTAAPSVSDNCTVGSLTWAMTGATTASGSNYIGAYTFNVGVTTVTYTATDASGNTTTMSFTVTVNDNQPPSLGSCPAPAPFYMNDTGQPYATLSFTAPSATDNCSSATVTWQATGATTTSGSGNITNVQFSEGETTVTYSATDASGNTATCTFIVKVYSLPVINCLTDIVGCDAVLDPGQPTLVSGTAPVSYGWVMSGATTGTGTGPIGVHTFNVGTTTISWTVGNTAGTANCTQTVTVNSGGTWLGITSDWNNASNWCGGIPTTTTNVTIPATGSQVPYYFPIITGTGDVHNLNLAAGASVTIQSGGVFNVSGDISGPGKIDATHGTIEFNGTATQQISSGMFKDTTIASLKVSNAAGLKVVGDAGGKSLAITDSISFDPAKGKLDGGGNITLKSTYDKTASLGVVGANNTVTGDFTVERYINSGTAPGQHGKKWLFLATPTKGQTIKDSWMEGGNPVDGYGTNMTSPDGIAAGWDAYSPSPSLKDYNGNTNLWKRATAADTTPLFNPKGWMVFVRGDRKVSGVNDPANTTILRSKGTLTTGNVQYNIPAEPVGATENWFFAIGNPYPASIDMRKVPGISQYTIWYPDSSGEYSLGAYVNYAKDGDGNFVRTPLRGHNDYVNFIFSGEAFFLQRNPNPETLTITEGDKGDTTYNADFFRPMGVSGTEAGWSSLRSNVYRNDILLDGTLQLFAQNYSNRLDRDDARKMLNTGVNLSVKVDDRLLVVERRNWFNINDTIFYNLTGVGNGKYHFTFEPANLAGHGLEAWLEDSYTKERIPVGLDVATEVNFEVTADAASKAANRFMMVFKTVPQPASFLKIEAVNDGNAVDVKWAVKQEINVEKYVVMYSTDGTNFTDLAEVDATGISQYMTVHRSPVDGYNYYRVRSVDIFGVPTYSDIAKVFVGSAEPSLRVFPNPVQNGVIQLRLKNYPEGKYMIRLLNPAGQLMLAKTFHHGGGNGTEKIPWDYRMAHGNYHLEVRHPDGSVKVILVMW